MIDTLLTYEPKIPRLTLDGFDDMNAIKNGFHVISVSFIGMTYFSSLCQYGLNINQIEQEKIIDPILRNKETGTLYPKHNLTILPYRYSTNAFMTIDSIDFTNGKGFDIDEVRSQLQDAFKAETEHVKSNKMFFDFRDLGEEMLRYNNVVQNILQNEFGDSSIECYMY